MCDPACSDTGIYHVISYIIGITQDYCISYLSKMNLTDRNFVVPIKTEVVVSKLINKYLMIIFPVEEW